MIRVRKRSPEPPALSAARAKHLPSVRAILNANPAARPKIEGYACVKRELFEDQHEKCAYCDFELPYEQGFDVEHFRPKAPDPAGSHDGYWWLAWTWSNLFFSCQKCNRTRKRSHFPPLEGSIQLTAEDSPPGKEKPALIDPEVDDPMDHIQFRRVNGRWHPTPREGSIRGYHTIRVLGLAHQIWLDKREKWARDFLEIRLVDMEDAIASGDRAEIDQHWKRVTDTCAPHMHLAGFAHDVIDWRFPLVVRKKWGLLLERP